MTKVVPKIPAKPEEKKVEKKKGGNMFSFFESNS